MNSVTLGDYQRPVQISDFIKDLFAGFQLLNLKNDILRKRSDGIKYSVRAPLSKVNNGELMLTSCSFSFPFLSFSFLFFFFFFFCLHADEKS